MIKNKTQIKRIYLCCIFIMPTIRQLLRDKNTTSVAIKATGNTGIGSLIIQNNGKQYQSNNIDSDTIATTVPYTELNISTEFLCFPCPFGNIERHTSKYGDYYDQFIIQKQTSLHSIIEILNIYSQQVQIEKNRADHFLKQLLDAGI